MGCKQSEIRSWDCVPHDSISGIMRWGRDLSLSLSPLLLQFVLQRKVVWGHSERWPSASQKSRLHPISTLHSDLRCSASEMVRKLMSVVSHPVYGICYGNSGRLRCRCGQILSEIRGTCYILILFITNLITNLKGSMKKEN